MKILHNLIALAIIIMIFSSNFAYAQTTSKVAGRIPLTQENQNLMVRSCGKINDAGDVDPQVIQYVKQNNPHIVVSNDNAQDLFWNTLYTKFISNVPQFQSIGGKNDTIRIHMGGNVAYSCPPIQGGNATFQVNGNQLMYQMEFYSDGQAFYYRTIHFIHTQTQISNFVNDSIPRYGPLGPVTIIHLESPLKQFRHGTLAKDVTCWQGLQLILKLNDGSPACVKPDTAIALVEHRWAINVPQPNPMTGLNNDTGIATLRNHTYYFETPNYTETAYVHPMQISFHDVTFTLFPSGFRGGLPAWGCGGGYYWADAKFSDGASELLQIFVGSKDCFLPQPSTHFSTHTNPQAGLTFYNGKMKLLVSTSVTNSTVTKELPASFMPCDTPFPKSDTGIPVLYMQANSVGKLCVRYTNYNGFSDSFYGGIRIFDPNNSYQSVPDVTTWSNLENTTTIQGGESFIVTYWIKTGNHTGFYGLNLFCGGTPFAIGYDNSSKLVSSDFPFVGYTHSCPVILYDTKIDSMTGIGIKYIPYPLR